MVSEIDEFDEIDDDADEVNNCSPAPRQKKSRKKYFWLILIVVLIVIGSFLAYVGYIGAKYNRMVPGQKSGTFENAKNLLAPENLKGEETGDINLLFIGMRDKSMDGAYYSSAMMVVNIDKKNNQINLISVPRDLWIPIDGNLGKANSVIKTAIVNKNKYPEEGLPFIKKTFSNVLGIDLNYIFTCDFDSFQKIIDKIGRINVQMSPSEAESYPFLKDREFISSKDAQTPGLYHFDGPQSLTFVSWPKDAVPDFDRLRRMQLFLFSFAKQYIDNRSLLKFKTVNNVLNVSEDNIRTNMQVWELRKIINLGEKTPLENIKQHRLTTDPSDPGGLLRESHYFNTTYNPIAGDSDFSQIQAWARKIIND